MKIRAEEIASVLRKEIEEYRSHLDVADVGVVGGADLAVRAEMYLSVAAPELFGGDSDRIGVVGDGMVVQGFGDS